jgi:hypothetical protein
MPLEPFDVICPEVANAEQASCQVVTQTTEL